MHKPVSIFALRNVIGEYYHAKDKDKNIEKEWGCFYLNWDKVLVEHLF